TGDIRLITEVDSPDGKINFSVWESYYDLNRGGRLSYRLPFGKKDGAIYIKARTKTGNQQLRVRCGNGGNAADSVLNINSRNWELYKVNTRGNRTCNGDLTLWSSGDGIQIDAIVFIHDR